ncbi:MAG TPA: hypothetical protein VFB03_00425 [Candidatus Saccharimonadales bacterium]|nr:hypothetical protein [Candidatus Saccharimonadales bacterium]
MKAPLAVEFSSTIVSHRQRRIIEPLRQAIYEQTKHGEPKRAAKLTQLANLVLLQCDEGRPQTLLGALNDAVEGGHQYLGGRSSNNGRYRAVLDEEGNVVSLLPFQPIPENGRITSQARSDTRRIGSGRRQNYSSFQASHEALSGQYQLEE